MEGVVDSRADITIMGGQMFKQVAAVAKLRKRDFKPPDKVPHNYDQQPFHLDGLIEIDITFQDKTMITPVYVKMDAKEQLLLSEGVCRQLGVITYHPDVNPCAKSSGGGQTSLKDAACIPTVRVKLVQSTYLPSNQSVVVEARLTNGGTYSGPLLIESSSAFKRDQSFQVVNSLVTTSDKNTVMVMLANFSGLAQKVKAGVEVRTAIPAEVVDSVEETDADSQSELAPTVC